MPFPKAPPKIICNATIQVRSEEGVDLKLRNDADSICYSPGEAAKTARSLVWITAVSGDHARRFRNTFAIELLPAGITLHRCDGLHIRRHGLRRAQ